MNGKLNRFSCLVAICLLAAVVASAVAADQHLMTDRAAEISLARSAASAAISDAATILVLEPHGYVTAVEGKNGFVCVAAPSM